MAEIDTTIFDDNSGVNDVSANLAELDLASILEKKPIYDDLVVPFPTTLGKAVSKKEREEMDLRNSTLIYGEAVFETLGTVLEKIRKVYGKPNRGSSGPTGVLQSNRGGVFYDLGSGTGKPVVAAAILHNFDVCYGIELLEGLYSVSLDLANAYNTRGKAKLGRETETRKSKSSSFISATLFFELMQWNLL